MAFGIPDEGVLERLSAPDSARVTRLAPELMAILADKMLCDEARRQILWRTQGRKGNYPMLFISGQSAAHIFIREGISYSIQSPM
jgi:hypothetical protein